MNWETAIIGELKNLEILSLFKSELTELLREIGLLTRLRLLDLRNCTKLKSDSTECPIKLDTVRRAICPQKLHSMGDSRS